MAPVEGTDATVLPVRDWSTARLVGESQSVYGGLAAVERRDNATVRLFGSERTLAGYAATANGPDGTERRVSVHVAAVRDGDDYVVVVGVVPADRDAVATLAPLLANATH